MDVNVSPAGRLSVLVAESQEVLRRELSAALGQMGLCIYEAGGGSETLDIVSTVKVHALVLDFDMPDLTGLETVRVIRTFQEVPPYLLLASVVTRGLQMAALDGHATSVLPKPVDTGLLSDIVQTMLMRSYGGRWAR